MRLAIFAISIFVASSTAMAGTDSPWYGVVGFGTAKVSSNLNDISASSGRLTFTQTVDTSGNALLGGVGYQLSDNLAFEAQYVDLSGFGANQTVTATNAVVNGTTVNGTFTANQDVKATGYAFSGKFDFLQNKESRVYGRLGFAQVKVKNTVALAGSGTIGGTAASVRASMSFDKTSTAPLYGIGYEYDFSKSTSLRTEYTHLNSVGEENTTGKSAVNMLLLQAKFKF